MRRSYLVLLMLLTFTATTAAQNSAQDSGLLLARVAPPPTLVAHASPEEVVNRIMSFDRNGDGKITKDEVLERMEDVVTRGDASGDGALDAAEIRALAQQPPAPAIVRGFRAGQYSFGDESGFSSRMHIEGALEDLRLASPAKEQAETIAKVFADTLEKRASTDLLNEMESLLTAEQLARFKVALDRQRQTRVMTVRSGAVGLQAATNQLRVFVMFMDINRHVEQFALPAAEKARAVAAIERFKKQLRPADIEWSPLLEQMQEILSDEEREDFRAALQRRPLVKADAVVGFQGVAGGVSGAVFVP